MACTRKLKRKLKLFFIFFIIVLPIMTYFFYQKDEFTGQEEEPRNLNNNYLEKKHMELDDLKIHYEEVIENQKKTYKELERKLVGGLKALIGFHIIDTGFAADDKGNRLYDMAVTDDRKVWMGGAGRELKLFDLRGHLHRTVTIMVPGMYICMYNRQVVFPDYVNKTVKKISDDGKEVTMFTTGDWIPSCITSSESGDLLVCLLKDDQSKVVRYSSAGTVLQEIQYDSHGKPLYQGAFYITENVNGDIIVSDLLKNSVTAVDKLGMFRYSYSGLYPAGVVTDSVGHVLVADYWGDKIHKLDMDGRFIRYITPEGDLSFPRTLSMINDDEVIVGECLTGFIKKCHS